MEIKRLLAMIVAMTALAMNAQETIRLWPDGAPVTNGDKDDEAELRLFLPSKEKATGRAVVMCPGGAYKHLAMEHEGTDWAYFFNHQGIALIVLKYRMPHGNPRVPVGDAEEAMRTVRRNAAEWNIAPQQVGIMGFSAGGHLASTVATQARGDASPDFQILFYPVITMEADFTEKDSRLHLLGPKPKKKDIRQYSNDKQVTRTTPRAFIALSDDDQLVPPANAAFYYQECYRHDVPATLHIYPTGGHGWGYREAFEFHMEMLLELKGWLHSF